MGIKRETYSLEAYLNDVEEKDIRPDTETQRKFKRRSNEWQDRLIKTPFSTKFSYIPELQLAEEYTNGKRVRYILNGLHRTMTLLEFKKGKHKISKNMKNSIVKYLKKRTDENGEFVLDGNGDFYYDETEYDLRGKCFDDLPVEMKRIFNQYQLSTVVFEDCSKEEQAEWVIILNEQNAMSAAQKAFTYTSNFAKQIRNIADNLRFFKDCGNYSQTEKENGTIERVVTESVMASFYLDNWKKDSKSNAIYINENASENDFNKVEEYLNRLNPLCENEIGEEKRFQNIFNSKNTFLFIALFDKFTKLGLKDNYFVEFLTALETELHNKKIDKVSWSALDSETGTKAKSLIEKKLTFLKTLMIDYLHVNKEETKSEDTTLEDFIKKNVSEDVTEEDISDYEGDLEIITLEVDNNSKLLNDENHNSLIAMIAHGYKEDISAEIQGWFVDYFKRNNMYFINQTKNYLHMLDDFNKYIKKNII